MINQILKIICILFILIIIVGCSDSGTEPQDNIILPDSLLNFNDHIYPLFTAKCSSRSACHAISSPAAGLILIDYNEIITHYMTNAPSELLINSGNGEGSPLYQVLIQQDYLGVPRMPYEGPYLNSNQYEGIKIGSHHQQGCERPAVDAIKNNSPASNPERRTSTGFSVTFGA